MTASAAACRKRLSAALDFLGIWNAWMRSCASETSICGLPGPQPTHRVGRVELLRHAHKRDTLAVEELHEPREVHQRTAEAVHLVDHDAVDLPGLDIGHQALERRALDVPAGEPAVVVFLGQTLPPLVLLAGDVRDRALALGVEAVELLVEPLLGALAGVDGAANRSRPRRGRSVRTRGTVRGGSARAL